MIKCFEKDKCTNCDNFRILAAIDFYKNAEIGDKIVSRSKDFSARFEDYNSKGHIAFDDDDVQGLPCMFDVEKNGH